MAIRHCVREFSMGQLSFKEWLAEQSSKRPNESDVAAKKEEWLNAIDELYAKMFAWIREDDPTELVKIWRASEAIEEEELGLYTAPSIRFVFNHRMASAVPIARNVLGPVRGNGPRSAVAEGRVDLKKGAERIHLYRIREPGAPSRWVVVQPGEFDYKDLNKESFEGALQQLLS